MIPTPIETGTDALAGRVGAVRAAVADLFAQEFRWSTGHWTAAVNGCVFAPSILTYWFVNGVVDFSTAMVLGTTAAPGGLQARIVAYVLAVPVFLSLRMSYYLAHPVYRQSVLEGACPGSELLSLDWFTVGIMMTGLPLAFRDLGAWLGMNAVFAVGIFVLPRPVTDERRAARVKVASVVAGSTLFAYANYGTVLAGALPMVPPPASVLGPIATLRLPPGALEGSLQVLNSLALGPPAVAVLGVVSNRLLTHPAIAEIPLVSHALPDRDPSRVVVASATTGTLFYLVVVAAVTGRLVVVP